MSETPGVKTELEQARDHARTMARAEHKPECDRRLVEWRRRAELWRWYGGPDPGEQPAVCHGCVSHADRVLWAQLADEYDARINAVREATPL